ncbi:Ig-like domain-containing protein [Streptomyces sp. NPDC005438]|uniref:L,D-transpeptidase n=1 Tax=Streptomyces sp. NPDC005438 TaxID=3156880 RepID=UPI0033B3057F
MSHRAHRRKAIASALILAPLAAGLTSCGDSSHPQSAEPYDAVDQVDMSAPDNSRTVDSSKPLVVTAKGEDRISDVVAQDASGRHLAGRLNRDGTRWHSTGPLAAGVSYTVRVSTETDGGAPGQRVLRFRTKPATEDRLKVSFGPKSGEYGVAQPLTAKLSQPVRNRQERRTVEQALKVESTPAVQGGWHWVDGKEVRFRPREYWPAHTKVTVRSTLDGVRVRHGLRGGESKPLSLTIGERVEATADAGSHQMLFKKNGKVIRKIPITTGKAGFRTRTGTKVVLEKQAFVRMRGTSVGIAEGSADSYDLPVHWATRLTWSGEYVHAAPWSVGSQGADNVSHGCTGMSTENAKWFFDHVRPGDPITHRNTEGEPMTGFDNGFGDWNVSWEKWKEGSALGDHGKSHRAPGASARLQPEL